jgi:hypothetical protein
VAAGFAEEYAQKQVWIAALLNKSASLSCKTIGGIGLAGVEISPPNTPFI